MFIDEIKASELTNIPRRTLQTWRVRGGGPPYYKINRSVKYDDAELGDWIRARRVTSTTDADRLQQSPLAAVHNLADGGER